jgi:hypothetical protein
MSDSHADNTWDEFRWERFLQEQEQRTEKYMDLLDKYMNHPQRDELIAKEMGWKHLNEEDANDWDEEMEAAFEDDEDEDDSTGDEFLCGFESNPLYQQALAFNSELDEMLDQLDEKAREHPAMNTLGTQITLATAKLAAALNENDSEELGMNIAYLKRALYALNIALGAVIQLRTKGIIEEPIFERLRGRVFAIRNDIVTITGEFRAEFRRRYGNS